MITPIIGYNKREQTFQAALFSKKTKPVIDKAVQFVDENSADYIKYHYNLVKGMCNKTMEVNVETGRLQDIVNSEEPCIFILNHTSNQIKDVAAGKFFNALLYREYIYNGKAETCPRSKVIANIGVLKRRRDGGDLYSKLGVIPVKAGIKTQDKIQNKETIASLVKGLVDGKINLFIFPEGALAMFKFLPMSWKFQPGVSSIIKKVLDFKDKIKVVPLGFAHKKNLSSAHIGEPVYFSKSLDGYFVQEGQNKKLLTHDKIPIDREEIVPYISGTLVQRLESAVKKAKEDLKNSSGKVFEL